MPMKKLLFILFVNIILCLCIFTIVIIISNHKNNYKVETDTIRQQLGRTERIEQDLPYNENLPPIVIIGCSFVYGVSIEQNETLAYKLQKLTNRKTYNYGTPGHGIQHVLYKIQYSDFFKKDLNPEYVIYIFISDHMRRMYSDYRVYTENTKYLRYKKVGKKLILKDNALNIKPLDYIKISRFGRKYNDYIFSRQSDDDKFDLLKLHLEYCKKELNKKYKDTKFVIVVYNDVTNSKRVKTTPFHSTRWNELEKEGFIVINFEKPEYDFLNDDNYISEIDSVHPNGKAWEKLTPIIAKKLNLI